MTDNLKIQNVNHTLITIAACKFILPIHHCFFLSTQLHFRNIYGAVPYPDQNSFRGNIWGTSFISLSVCTACFMHSWTLKTAAYMLLAACLYEIPGCVIHILLDFLLNIDTITKLSAFVYLILATALCSWFPELRVTECQIIFTIFLNQWSDFIKLFEHFVIHVIIFQSDKIMLACFYCCFAGVHFLPWWVHKKA